VGSALNWLRRKPPAPPPYPDPEKAAELCREIVSMLPTRKYVLIEHVLAELDPEHKIAFIPRLDPRADPLTGCLPVTAPELPGDQ
jgi:hypothetical protein